MRAGVGVKTSSLRAPTLVICQGSERLLMRFLNPSASVVESASMCAYASSVITSCKHATSAAVASAFAANVVPMPGMPGGFGFEQMFHPA